MPTFSSNYQIKLIGTGEEAGTWGTSTNQNLERIEQALGESVSIAVTSISGYSAGSPSTATWLTSDTADAGAALSQGRAGFVEFTSGSDVGASGVIVRVRGNDSSIYPNRIFLVKNSLSDSRDLKLNSNSTDDTNIVTIANGCHALVYTDGTHARNALSKLQIDDLLFPAAADITLANSLTAALEIKSTASNSEFLRFDTSNNHLEVAPGSGVNTVEIQAATVDASSQNTSISIRDGQADSFEILEGTNSYLKFNTSSQTVHIGEETSDVETLDISTNTIRLADQATDLRISAGSTTALTVSDSTGTILTVDTGTEPEKIITAATTELEVLGTLDVDGTSHFSAAATFTNIDVDGGTIDGATINSSSIGVGTPAAGDFTEVGVTTSNGIHMEHADAYINFDSTNSGSSYRGIRRNGTDLQVKNTNSDDWGQPYHTGMVSGQGSYFANTDNSITNATAAYSYNHSFSAIPSIAQYYLQNNSGGAIAGYADTDMVGLSSFVNTDDGNRTCVTTWVTSDAIGVSILYNASVPFRVMNKTDGTSTNIDLADWDLVVRAWK